jgi:hypothetical protein
MESSKVVCFLQEFEKHDLARIFPDETCLDAKGAVCLASPWGNVGIHRVLERGETTDQVKIETQSFAVALGGLIGRQISGSPIRNIRSSRQSKFFRLILTGSFQPIRPCCFFH